MALAVDTVSNLSNISWSEFYAWMGHYPIAAGRYFGGGHNWSDSEFTAAKSATGGVLSRIMPLQGCQPSRQETDGTTGYDYGSADGKNTCGSIEKAISAGQLALPSSAAVYVWLDVEPNVAITPAYWAGWANEVNRYGPFYACIYTQYVDESGVWVPQSTVQYALNNSYHYWPKAASVCWGLWTSEPEGCSLCPASAVPDWSVFGKFYQSYDGTNILVPLYLYQYAEKTVCVTDCGESSFAGKQNLDLDGTDSTGAEACMLNIT